MKCNLCEGNRTKLLFKVNKPVFYSNINSFDIVKCLDCGLIYINQKITFEELLLSYEKYNDKCKPKISSIFEISHRNRLKLRLKEINKFKQTGKLLDIGSGDGAWMEFVKKNGWEVYGVEIVSSLATSAKDKGLKVFRGTLEQAKFPNSFFDVITMTDVIEHLPNPKKTLEEIHRILKKNGIVMITTMDISSLNARMAKGRWQYIGLHHLYYFSNQTLKKMLESVNLHIVKNYIDNKMFRHFIYYPIAFVTNDSYPPICDHRMVIATK